MKKHLKTRNENYLGNNLRKILEERQRVESGFLARMERETRIPRRNLHLYKKGMEPKSANLLIMCEFLQMSPWDIINKKPLHKPVRGYIEVDEV